MPVCNECGKTTGFLDLLGDVCGTCRTNSEKSKKVIQTDLEDTPDIILTTAIDIPGRQTVSIVDIVGAEVAVGMNIFKDIANAWRDTFGGRSGSTQNTLRDARAQCMLDLRREAFRLGADAVIAVRIFYSEATSSGGSGGGILIVAATGTAVKLQ